MPSLPPIAGSIDLPSSPSMDPRRSSSSSSSRASSRNPQTQQPHYPEPLPGFIDLLAPRPPRPSSSSTSSNSESLEYAHPFSSSQSITYQSKSTSGNNEDGSKKSTREKMDAQHMWTYFIAGGLAGAASRTVVSPLERLKIILQVQPKPTRKTLSTTTQTRSFSSLSLSLPSSSAQPPTPAQYQGVYRSLLRIHTEEGFLGFFKGNGINCLRIIPYSGVQFGVYEGVGEWMRTYTGNDVLSTPMRLTAGAIAGTASVVSTYPLDLVRARLSIATATIARRPSAAPIPAPSSSSSSRTSTTLTTTANNGTAYVPLDKHGRIISDRDLGVWGMGKKVYMTEGGVKGLYRGMVATAVGVAPYVSLNFFFYESLKTYLIPPDPWADPDSPQTSFRTLVCGAISGTASQTLTYPFDVLRRKMQVAGSSEYGPKYKGAWDAMVQITRAEGWFGGMYRGIWPNLLKVAPSIATSFWVYESVRNVINAEFERRRESQWVTG